MQKYVKKSEEPKSLPSIILDAESGKFEISGRSLPEDVLAFYTPIIDWLDEYSKNPNDETVFEFKLNYYNTASSKLLYEIMKKLEYVSEEGKKVLVKWYYDEDDEDMAEAGEEYEEVVTEIEFEHIEIPASRK